MSKLRRTLGWALPLRPRLSGEPLVGPRPQAIQRTFPTPRRREGMAQRCAARAATGPAAGADPPDRPPGRRGMARRGSRRRGRGSLRAPYKPSTLRGYEQSLRDRILPALGDYRLSELRRIDVQALVDALAAEGLAPATIRNTLDPLRAIYRRAIARELVAVNPTPGSSCPRAGRARPDRRPRRGRGADRGPARRRAGAVGDRLLCRAAARRAAGAALVGHRPRALGDPRRAFLGSAEGRSSRNRRRASGRCRCSPCCATTSTSTSSRPSAAATTSPSAARPRTRSSPRRFGPAPGRHGRRRD